MSLRTLFTFCFVAVCANAWGAATRVPGTLKTGDTTHSGHYTLKPNELVFEFEKGGVRILDLADYFESMDDAVVIQRGKEELFANLVRMDLSVTQIMKGVPLTGAVFFDVFEPGGSMTFEFDDWNPKARQYRRRQTKREITVTEPSFQTTSEELVLRSMPVVGLSFKLPYRSWKAPEDASEQQIAVHSDDRKLYPVFRVGHDRSGKPLYVFAHDLKEGQPLKVYSNLESRLVFTSGTNLRLVEDGKDEGIRKAFTEVTIVAAPADSDLENKVQQIRKNLLSQNLLGETPVRAFCRRFLGALFKVKSS